MRSAPNARIIAAVALFSLPSTFSQTLCDVDNCICDGVDLSSLKSTVKILADTDGKYMYKVAVCSRIPDFDLPSGCQETGISSEQPAAIRYDPSNPSDCIEVGGVSGMSGKKSASSTLAVDITYTYTYGCENSFILHFTADDGVTTAPDPTVTQVDCEYTATNWPAQITAAAGQAA